MTSRDEATKAGGLSGVRDVPSLDEPPLTGERKLPDRRAVSFRWMAGTILIGSAAVALLAGALRGAFGDHVRFAAAPVVSLPRFAGQVADEARRGDRLDRRLGSQGNSAALKIEQLSDAGAVRRFTRVSARLAEIDLEPHQEAPGDEKDEARPGSQRDLLSELPAIIRTGPSRRPLPGGTSAYADGEDVPHPPVPIGEAVNVTNLPKSPSSSRHRRHVIIARSGDTLSAILRALAAAAEDAPAILAAFPSPGARETLSGGDKITVIEQGGDAGSPRGHVAKVSIERAGSDVSAVGRTDGGQYQPIVPEQPDIAVRSDSPLRESIDTHSVPGETLRDGLNALARSNHVDQGIVAELMRLCGRDFDLDEPLGDADVAEIIYAPNDIGQPELVFIDLTAGGQTRRYYRFTAPDDGSSDFYDETGQSITKFLLRKPVVSGRLGDGFGWRIHPILGDRRFHEGVDYAAPYGSPIAAAGAGVVETEGYERGYGKFIRVRHDRGYETTYAHVASFPPGLKIGDRVRQGETIAFVGSTGLSTGPHLYYEVRINGRNVDPLRMKLSGGRLLQGDLLGAFDRQRDSINQLAAVSALPQRRFGSEHRPPT
ncbi:MULTISPECIES: M23 family metallopeptidase [Bradyrhizobium]|jgi:murein DD-endopeptidase MepM/ murein hydrolase activator NlpD|uniref:M23 family metallopeptidase n=1 Tax=Bradyrhizobium TaxID=374 RepID=UPI000483B73A|nr:MULTISPECIES: M23 family metallopeptidase [Bradyrhizobium]MCS3449520.1 murein DD-endopeptidase MepM/ murein hydrolase activator NlpD [Bradyrhizobium elkanii]MCS3559337.1 murein DD-endopeptidase MepM/ murein hydrolase activator NlpD [Bradyrhizobium elkanii]MCW2150817.1 murein DD-endopeptidase MepM/ murein hydrolase activator NlpD [Bradyrhizobium elkanii]MCW2359113.1 murein DD-endopeptidase MepM/ murein hydrolase activator NlpD [Bradyrhizobium elkanii]MCW2374548.1 murein DD-endopeptidase MepM